VKRTAKWGIDPARLRLVLNATAPSSDVKPAQIEAAVGLPIFWKLPHDRGVSKSIQLGRPIAEAPGKSSFAASVTSLALLIAGTKTAIAPQPESIPAWRRLLQFRGRNNDAVMGTAKELSDI
jgi:Flp pilus assembly CpaE family ATPase